MSDDLIVKYLINGEESYLYVVEDFCQDFTDELLKIPLEHYPEIKIMGKIMHQRRDVAFFSDLNETAGYKYSGTLMKSNDISKYDLLQYFLKAVNESLGTKFNGILVNRYA